MVSFIPSAHWNGNNQSSFFCLNSPISVFYSNFLSFIVHWNFPVVFIYLFSLSISLVLHAIAHKITGNRQELCASVLHTFAFPPFPCSSSFSYGIASVFPSVIELISGGVGGVVVVGALRAVESDAFHKSITVATMAAVYQLFVKISILCIIPYLPCPHSPREATSQVRNDFTQKLEPLCCGGWFSKRALIAGCFSPTNTTFNFDHSFRYHNLVDVCANFKQSRFT